MHARQKLRIDISVIRFFEKLQDTRFDLRDFYEFFLFGEQAQNVNRALDESCAIGLAIETIGKAFEFGKRV